ncbi:MAG: radical SAM protein [Bacteroidales bacterium]|nr:radical SAM protein [Bacteroidales bacterium]
MKAFGPIPSRRLGRSLGINNIPPKVCSYSCVYCQLGKAIRMETERREHYDPLELVEEIKQKVAQLKNQGEKIDYLSLVPDGEPTLDINLGKEIELLKSLGVRIAVITNSSLLWRQDVRDELKAADWVSVKVDAVKENCWKHVDRPHKNLNLESILDGIKSFSKEFKGKLVTETMLIKGINDAPDQLEKTALFTGDINPAIAYLSIPTRPPARKDVTPADETSINKAYQIFSEKIHNVELLLGYEGNSFASSGNAEEDLLSITAVHPMREEAVRELLQKDNAQWEIVEKLLEEEKLLQTEFNGRQFFMRKLGK